MLKQVDWSKVPSNLPALPGKSSHSDAEDPAIRALVDAWSTRILPLVERDGKAFHFKNKADHWTQAFPWNAKPKKEAKGLVEVARIWTLHRYGYYGFFKPSVAEVIQQIPKELLPRVDYFLVRGPDHADDLNATYGYVNKGFHVAETILYAKPKKENPMKRLLKRLGFKNET